MAKLNYYAEDINRALGEALTAAAWNNGALWFESLNGNFGVTIPAATNSESGLMSKESFTQLNNLQGRMNDMPAAATSASLYQGDNDVRIAFFSRNSLQLFDVTIPAATDDTAGLMSAADKRRLYGLKSFEFIEITEIIDTSDVYSVSITTYDGICYNKRSGKLVAMNGRRYYNNWPNADRYGSELASGGWVPYTNALYICGGNMLKFDGSYMWKAEMNLV